jgi:TPR repeat protein
MHDTGDAARWADQAIDMRHLTDLMERASAQHVLFIADACGSGFMTARGQMERWDLKTSCFGRSRAVLAATTRHQRAGENAAKGSGDFTAALLDEWRTQGAATALDIFYPLSRSVPKSTNGRMTPQFCQFGTGDGMFVFVPQSIPRDEIENDLNGAGRDAGVAGAVRRAEAEGKQQTTYAEFLATLAAASFRPAEGAEDFRAEWEQRADRFRRNASSGNVWAAAALCVCHETGLRAEKNAEKAYLLARQADRVATPAGVGRYLLGRCEEAKARAAVSGRAAGARARELYLESAARGFGPGRWAAAMAIMRDGLIDDAQTEQALKLLEAAAADGLPAARVDLAALLLSNRTDPERAMRMLSEAADGGHPCAHHQLFVAYSEDKPGYPAKDLARAERHLRRAAELGSVGALVDLGNELCGQSGRLKLPVDYKQGFGYLDRAAQRDDALGLVQTARLCALGLGVPNDPGDARARLDKAVALGHPAADQVQGEWHLAGRVYPQSDERALEAFKRGAARGNAVCGFRAGKMILEGRGVKARNGRKDGTYHDEWHQGLSHLVAAHQAGGVGARDRKFIEGTVDNFVEVLEGGSFSKDLDRQRRERPRGLHDEGLQAQAGGKSGGPGERRLFQLMDGGLVTVTLHGEYILRATSLAAAWRREYPDTFRYFCEKWGVDPKTLKVDDGRVFQLPGK